MHAPRTARATRHPRSPAGRDACRHSARRATPPSGPVERARVYRRVPRIDTAPANRTGTTPSNRTEDRTLAFLAKKLLSILLQPLGAAVALLLLALLRRRHRDRWVWIGLAGLCVFGSAMPVVQQWVGAPLEAGLAVHRPQPGLPAPRVIVVLSGGYERDATRELWDEMNVSTLRRTLEGIRLAHLYPRATLWLSGGDPWGRAPPARAMAALALHMGVPAQRVRIETASRDTHDQALALARAVGGARMLLVTSAYHMPRSMALFRAAGCNPTAAPTDFITSSDYRFDLWDLRPNPGAMQATGLALHEHAGLVWSRLRGQAAD